MTLNCQSFSSNESKIRGAMNSILNGSTNVYEHCEAAYCGGLVKFKSLTAKIGDKLYGI